MKLYKIISITMLFCITSFCTSIIIPMEANTLSHNDFDFCSPSKLLQSIKNLQEKKCSPKNIALALKQSLKNTGQNLGHITEFIYKNKFSDLVNILYFLDEAWNKDTISTIISSFDTEKDACNFIIETNNLEHVWKEGCEQCALPILKLLWAKGVKIEFSKTGFLKDQHNGTMNSVIMSIDDMITKERKKLTHSWCCCRSIPEDEISNEVALLELIKELRKCWHLMVEIYLPDSKIS